MHLTESSAYNRIVELSKQLASVQDSYAKSVVVYLDRRRRTTYVRIFPDHERVTAYRRGEHSPLYKLRIDEMYDAIVFARNTNGHKKERDMRKLFLDVVAAMEEGAHSGNDHQMPSKPRNERRSGEGLESWFE